MMLIVWIIILCTIIISSFILNIILKRESISFRVRRSCLNQFIFIWIGISAAIFCQNHLKGRGLDVIKYMESDGSLWNRISHMKNLNLDKKKIIFITTTDYSVTQVASLTRTAQALFPVKDKVAWVVVALPLASSNDNEQVVSKNGSTFDDSVRLQQENVTQQYFKNLKNILHRFGIQFVLLQSYGDHKPLDTSWSGQKWPETSNEILQGYQMGFLWAIRNVSRGVIMVGDVSYTYNSAIFSELQETKAASCWATGFPAYYDSLGIPIYSVSSNGGENNETERIIIGHDDGSDLILGSVPVERGAFAIDLDYLRTHVPFKDQWKLSSDGLHTTSDLNIDLQDIQIMGKRGDEIFVWRTEAWPMQWPDSIKVVKNNNMPTETTNVKTLLETAFGPRYYLMPDIVVKVERKEEIVQYDLEALQPYMG